MPSALAIILRLPAPPPSEPRAVLPNDFIAECGIRFADCRELKVIGKVSFRKTVLMDRDGGEFVAKHMLFIKGRITHDQQVIFTRTLASIAGLTPPCILPFIGSGQISGDEVVLFLPYMTHRSLNAHLNTDPQPS
jgi:hypothetical protein